MWDGIIIFGQIGQRFHNHRKEGRGMVRIRSPDRE